MAGVQIKFNILKNEEGFYIDKSSLTETSATLIVAPAGYIPPSIKAPYGHVTGEYKIHVGYYKIIIRHVKNKVYINTYRAEEEADELCWVSDIHGKFDQDKVITGKFNDLSDIILLTLKQIKSLTK